MMLIVKFLKLQKHGYNGWLVRWLSMAAHVMYCYKTRFVDEKLILSVNFIINNLYSETHYVYLCLSMNMKIRQRWANLKIRPNLLLQNYKIITI